MPAQIPDSIAEWSTTAGSNQPSGSSNVGPDLDDNLRAIQAAVRLESAATSIASASTTDLSTTDQRNVTVSGTTTITALGTVSAGVSKVLIFSGTLTLTHNATSLILPTAANITTAAGDIATMLSLGSGNWRCITFQRASAIFPAALSSGLFLTNNGTATSWAAPAASLSSLTAATATNTLANGAYKQTWGWTGIATDGAGLELSGAGSGSAALLRLKGTADFLLEVNESTLTNNRSLYISPSGGITAGGVTMVGAGNGTGHSIKGNNAAATSGGNGGSVLVYGGNGDGVGNGGSVTVAAGAKGASGAAGSVQLANGATNTVTLSDAATTLGGTTKLVLDQKHAFVDNTNGAPTVTSGGGTGVTIAGSDVAFEVIAGTGSPTTFTVTFANAWASAPQVVLVSCSQAGVRLSYVATTTTVQVSTDSAWSSGAKISVLCLGLQ